MFLSEIGTLLTSYENFFWGTWYIAFLKSILKVLLVTGGWRGTEALSSTEVYVDGDSAWTQGPPLPIALTGIRGVSGNNEVLMIGTYIHKTGIECVYVYIALHTE